uniref:NADH dehydrogenase subunit 4L n=1 Tax=Lamproglena orientalis TaxID=342426 RepID=UPI00286CA510|nr:NADH dehydrogenase subunit 4L [Lamproglena orientalis]YP_010924932.1 NADH dehydrogenase subunit 4L [Lamproglena orientalis]WKB11678.1 NADH dehydrogenase subunit 4L [Lamproglena orientalis]WKB11691.1 NADH dehydrogenase subunit 4L [Lamproglena orientalis]WKB11730.1 NADH dehydrogenase subunit 4L [Lamproglena orientalis]WKB11743.1 NADH dehydrogenase subunit 4L [Lamproglena orientalis]
MITILMLLLVLGTVKSSFNLISFILLSTMILLIYYFTVFSKLLFLLIILEFMSIYLFLVLSFLSSGVSVVLTMIISVVLISEAVMGLGLLVFIMRNSSSSMMNMIV